MAFTLPEEKKYINGFCGPLDIDNKKWVAVSLAEAGYVPKGGTGMPAFRYGKAVYYPGHLFLKSGNGQVEMDQESVDLNAYLALEYRILREIAGMLCQDFQEPDRTSDVAPYFFDKDHGYFFDKKLQGGFV